MIVDFARWAVVAHKDDTGFGRMAADVKRVLGLRRQIVIPSERLVDHSLDQETDCVLRPDDPAARVAEVLTDLQGIIFFERPAWHPALLETARHLGVATVCVPMWEWFKGDAPEWVHCDLFACPSQFTATIVRRYGWTNVAVLPWALDVDRLPRREIRGPAKIFVHNAGLVDQDDRKGTRDTLAAFRQVPGDDLRLIVRVQKPVPLPNGDPRIEIRIGNLPDPAELYASGDCMIQPSKMEGIGFMVLEPVACGLPVITTDYPPMSEFVSQPELRVKKRWFKRRAFANHWIAHAHLRLPHGGDLAHKIAWCATNDLTAVSHANRLWAESEFRADRVQELWRQEVSRLRLTKLTGRAIGRE
jgi:glycosyltransferase involved in cell wall biosynthesis